MTAHVHPLPVDAVASADAWFATLGRSYKGRLPASDPLLAGGGSGWLVATLGKELAVTVDAAFPFTRPRVYLRGARTAMPHVERDGRLCLRNPEVPAEPATAVSLALGAARGLLRDIASGSQDEDFEEDFGLYWRQSAESGTRARLLIPEAATSGVIAWTTTAAGSYGFASHEALRRWWRHRFGSDRTKVRQGALVKLDRLPRPDIYPRTGAELWDLIAARSADGLAILASLLRQTPKRLLIVLAGTAPSGRRHAVGLMLSRPTDPFGRPVNRRVVERGFGRGKTPPDVICDRYDVSRLDTESLDAAGSRLPYAERDRLGVSRVAVIGCGALGSSVARLLAKSGVGHLVLVDPELLGWENIRRHQLGAGSVGYAKALALERAVGAENPDIGSVKGRAETVEKLMLTDAHVLRDFDLIVACTANWSANSALDAFAQEDGRPPVLYAWMEAHALAAHAVLVLRGHSYRDGYDVFGNARLTASTSRKPVPAECGSLTSPFGAIEVAQAEALVGRLAVDYLRGKVTTTTWRTWLTDEDALADAEGTWTDDWVSLRGLPNPLGQMSAGPWWER